VVRVQQQQPPHQRPCDCPVDEALPELAASALWARLCIGFVKSAEGSSSGLWPPDEERADRGQQTQVHVPRFGDGGEPLQAGWRAARPRVEAAAHARSKAGQRLEIRNILGTM